MSIALTLAAVAVVAVVLVVRAKRRAARNRNKPIDVFYVCRQCEHPYAIPNVPTRCRRCGGPVDKQF